jgi:alkyl hydroperoxide reductase subunit AhpC
VIDHAFPNIEIITGIFDDFGRVERKQAEMEERIRRNKIESEQRDRARREAAVSAAASPSAAPKKGESPSASEPSTPCPPIPRTSSLSRSEFEQWTSKVAPTFKCEAFFEGDFVEFDLAEHQGRWVILLFMPLELDNAGVSAPNTAGTELLLHLEEKMHSFVAKHADVVVVSPESKHFLKKLAESPHTEGGLGGVSFRLVSDLNAVAASLYGIAGSAASQATLYILAPQMVIQSREALAASHPPSAEHILELLTKVQLREANNI